MIWSPKVNRWVRSLFRRKNLPLDIALAFDNVTLPTLMSDIDKRSDIQNFRTNLSRNFSLNLPIVSANMEDVTDADMAIALARIGGMGFIHQFLSLEDRIAQVQRVKRADNAVIEDPVTVPMSATLKQAKEQMDRYGVSSVLVIDEDRKLHGILTWRDYRFCRDDSVSVLSVMASPVITVRENISREDAVKKMARARLEKLPIVDADGRVRGLMSAKDILKEKEFPNAAKDSKGRLVVGVALRLNSDYLLEAKKLLAAGADVLLLDTARAGSTLVLNATRHIRKNFPKATLVVGNIDNPDHVIALAEAGADCVKVGVGPGARCKTRMVAGVGMPQLFAIATCAAAAKKLGIYVIGDGGIRGSNDLAKALVAGADAVMIGSLFAGTEESPGITIRKGNQLFKQYRGSASLEHQLERIQKGSLDKIRNPEGESSPVPYSGTVKEVVDMLLDGLRSSMSYLGARNLRKHFEKSVFYRVSDEGYDEGKPRN